MLLHWILFFNFLSIVTLVKNAMIQLVPDAPSFAIHGKRISNLESITLQVNEKSDILIDYTQNGCSNLEKGYCSDAPQVTINGVGWEKCGDVEEIPFSDKNDQLGGYFYRSSSQMIDQTELVIAMTDALPKNDDFAISFRVRQWVNVSKKIFVFPGIPSNNQFNGDGYFKVFVNEGVIATVLPNPDNYNYGAWDGGPVTVQSAVKSVTKCPYFWQNITCPAETTYSIFSGSDPGNKMDSTNLLLKADGDILVTTRTTASTIFTNDACSFCLLYDSRSPAANGLL
ncbi:unnamed protein product, partial [Mesorhabditis belari]|uniref:Uncharacterized protein n=1 Tax=Mesorhabditis belari TaxID=2138241 RepID=A0AAF3EGC4_9BILA